MASDQQASRYLSPLRYPGGKGKVANFLKILFIENSMGGVNYVEPYAGGASVALALLFDGYVSSIHINDLNRGVYEFWRSVLDDPDALCVKINRVPLSIKEWQSQRAIYQDPSATPEEVGFATFYLNRTNRSGIISRGGVIGGNEQLGAWKIDARFNRESLCERIEKIAARSSQIKLTKLDALDVIENYSKSSNGDDYFSYLDPPYYVKGSRLYDNFYNHDDHVRVHEAVQGLPSRWLVSYDAAPQILKLYAKHARIQYSLGYSVSRASQGSEVMFFSDSLNVPDVISPAQISAREVVIFGRSRHVST